MTHLPDTNIRIEKYIYPAPKKTWDGVIGFIKEIRKFPSTVPCPWAAGVDYE